MKCPLCRSEEFYIKDSEDEFETYEFHVKEGKPLFHKMETGQGVPDLKEDIETYCDNCSWHGKLSELKS